VLLHRLGRFMLLRYRLIWLFSSPAKAARKVPRSSSPANAAAAPRRRGLQSNLPWGVCKGWGEGLTQPAEVESLKKGIHHATGQHHKSVSSRSGPTQKCSGTYRRGADHQEGRDASESLHGCDAETCEGKTTQSDQTGLGHALLTRRTGAVLYSWGCSASRKLGGLRHVARGRAPPLSWPGGTVNPGLGQKEEDSSRAGGARTMPALSTPCGPPQHKELPACSRIQPFLLIGESVSTKSGSAPSRV
jgi:hypothetical protein